MILRKIWNGGGQHACALVTLMLTIQPLLGQTVGVLPTSDIASAAAPTVSSTWPPPSDTIVVTGEICCRRPEGPPVPPGFRPSGCDSFLPAGLKVAPDAQRTLFWYRLAPDGSVHETSLYRSSGNTDLDKAALACADAAHTKPEIVAGKTAEIAWVGEVNWIWSGYLSFRANPVATEPELCRFFPREAIIRHEQGDVIVGYHIGTDGAPKDETLVQSSGHRSLDDATLRCVGSFRYFPAYHNGQPVELDRSVRFEWRIL